MKLLLDNNLSPQIARAIAAIVSYNGHEVIALRDRFPPDCKDVVWIVELGKQGSWSVLSGDIAITKKRLEKAAWHSSSLKGFFLAPAWSKLTNLQKAAGIMLWWPKFVAQEELVAPGAMFEVPINPKSRLRQI